MAATRLPVPSVQARIPTTPPGLRRRAGRPVLKLGSIATTTHPSLPPSLALPWKEMKSNEIGSSPRAPIAAATAGPANTRRGTGARAPRARGSANARQGTGGQGQGHRGHTPRARGLETLKKAEKEQGARAGGAALLARREGGSAAGGGLRGTRSRPGSDPRGSFWDVRRPPSLPGPRGVGGGLG